MQHLYRRPAAAVVATPDASMFPAAARRAGALAVRANADDPRAMFAQLQQGVQAMRQQVESGLGEHTEQIDNLITSMAALQASVTGEVIGSPSGLGASAITASVRSAMIDHMRGVSAAMEIGSGPDGGYAVPTQIDGTVMRLLRQTSPLRRLATQVTLGTGAGSWRKIVTAVGGGSRWAHELEERQETATPKLGAVEITPEEIYAIPEVTNHVLDDASFNLEAFLRDDVTEEFGLGESLAFIAGDGVKQPLGFLRRPTSAAADAAREFGTYQHVNTGVAGDFADDEDGGFQSNLIDLIFTLRAPYRRGDGVAWMMNSLTASKVMKFRDADGRLIWTNGLSAGDPDRLLGYPVEIDENMPDIGAGANAVAFGNWRRGYAIVDRPGLKLIRDSVTKKGWTKLYFSRRVGGAPLDTNAIKFLRFAAA